MNNLRKFSTEADYSAATLNYPAVSWVIGTDTVHFDKTEPTPTMLGDLKITYNVTSTSEPTTLFSGGGSGSGSGSGSEFAPNRMWVDGVEIGNISNQYQFSTTGDHIVEYSLDDGQIADNAFKYIPNMKDVTIGSGVTSIGETAFYYCGITSCTIGSSVTSIGQMAFDDCTNLISVTCLPTIPPSLPYGSFNNNASGRKIYVPSASVEDYKGDADWYELAVDIEPIS